MTAPTFSPQLIGQAENTLRALLHRFLEGTDLTYHTWVLLNATAMGGGEADRNRLTAIATNALKIDPAAVDEAITSLSTAGLLATAPGLVRLTDAGRALHQDRSAVIAQATGGILRDVAADDLAATARVLTTMTSRANEILAATS